MTRAGMTQRLASLALLLVLAVAACGKYGRPLRPSEVAEKRAARGAGDVTAPHPADCQDPAHEHADESGPGEGDEQ